MKRRLAALLQRGYALTLALRDERIPGKAKAIALLALAWVFVPLDFDFVPLLGWVDDAVVVLVASRVVDSLSPDGLFEEFQAQSPRTIRRVAAVVVLFGLLVVGAFAALVWWLFLA